MDIPKKTNVLYRAHGQRIQYPAIQRCRKSTATGTVCTIRIRILRKVLLAGIGKY
jgi:hypothetical protein